MAGNISKFCISSAFLTGKLAHKILTFVFNIKNKHYVPVD